MHYIIRRANTQRRVSEPNSNTCRWVVHHVRTIFLRMWYSTEVHKSFYASGFLYHSPSEQILLQQLQNGTDITLVLFSGTSRKGNTPQAVFQRCVEKALGVTLDAASIHPVYDYIHHRLGEQFIFYVEIGGSMPGAYPSKNKTDWVSLSKLSKCNMSEQTRHDITIGERVIRSLVAPPRVPQYLSH
mgnify:CR=1 FL=1